MTARELIAACTQRGIALRADGDRVRARGLRAEERSFLRGPNNARAVAALLALESALAAETAEHERQQRALVAESERARAERQRRFRRDVMACWEPEKVRAMVEAGKLTAEEITEWVSARDERLRRADYIAASRRGSTFRQPWDHRS